MADFDNTAHSVLNLTSAQLRMAAVMLNAVQSTLQEDSALRADVFAVFAYIVNTYEWLQGEIAAASENNTAPNPGDSEGENHDAPAAENSNSSRSADAPFFH